MLRKYAVGAIAAVVFATLLLLWFVERRDPDPGPSLVPASKLQDELPPPPPPIRPSGPRSNPGEP